LPRRPTYPLVLDGVNELAAGSGDLLRKMARATDATPLAPVFSGPPIKQLPEALMVTCSQYLPADVVVTDRVVETAASETEPAMRTPSLDASLLSGSLDILEYFFDREEASQISEGTLCQFRTETAGLLADRSDLRGGTQHAIVPAMPDSKRGPTGVAEAITRSVEEHGAEPEWLTDEMKAAQREQFQNGAR
jgi:hypothetical protein